MRKLMVLAAMLAMMLAAASPAFAQATAVDFGDDNGFDSDFGGSVFDDDFGGGFGDDEDDSVNVSDSFSTNVSQVTVDQTSLGDQNSASVDGEADNSANEIDLFAGQFNSGFDGDFDGDGILDEFDF